MMHTVYQFKQLFPEDSWKTANRPCGMNNLLHISQTRPPSTREFNNMLKQAKQSGFLCIVHFRDEAPVLYLS